MNSIVLGMLGMPELIVILVIVVLVFGVGKLPEVGKQLGSGIRNFKSELGGEDRDSLSADAEDQAVTPRDVTEEHQGEKA